MSMETCLKGESLDQVDERYQTVYETRDTNFSDFLVIWKWPRSGPTKIDTISIRFAGVENLRRNLIPIGKELKKV